jgi:hypothetical protein
LRQALPGVSWALDDLYVIQWRLPVFALSVSSGLQHAGLELPHLGVQ